MLGMSLSYEQQFYEWKIINMTEARYELFKAALLHFVLFVGSLTYHYYKYSQNHQFQALNTQDDDF